MQGKDPNETTESHYRAMGWFLCRALAQAFGSTQGAQTDGLASILNPRSKRFAYSSDLFMDLKWMSLEKLNRQKKFMINAIRVK